MSVTIYEELKKRFADLCAKHDLMDRSVVIKARALTTEEAIGDPEADDFPLQQGRERLMQAEFLGAFGQAFTDRYGDYQGTLGEIVEMEMANNYRRAVFVAAVNAVLRHLGIADHTVHCRDKGPALCAKELGRYLEDRFGRVRILQVGFQPAMVEELSQRFEYRVLDMDPANIGNEKRGAFIEGPDATGDAVKWADMLLVTGTTLVNDTITSFLTGKPVLFYGTTIAGAAALMDWPRFCASST